MSTTPDDNYARYVEFVGAENAMSRAEFEALEAVANGMIGASHDHQ